MNYPSQNNELAVIASLERDLQHVKIKGAPLKLWYCTDFKGFWPVGTAALAIAGDAEEAARLINEQLSARGLQADVTSESVNEMTYDEPKALILLDGAY
jgi:hypothetical protein